MDDFLTAEDLLAPYLPSPEEIASHCRSFQDVWSDQEKLRRAGANRPQPVELEARSNARRRAVPMIESD